jgi:hypothetical protein
MARSPRVFIVVCSYRPGGKKASVNPAAVNYRYGELHTQPLGIASPITPAPVIASTSGQQPRTVINMGRWGAIRAAAAVDAVNLLRRRTRGNASFALME